MVDATPLVKDVFGRRLAGADADGSIWRTVLITGLRGGGAGYIALDVTDPLEPKFLWQFAAPGMASTYGVPALSQFLVSSGGVLQERAIAVLAGGYMPTLTGTDLGGEPITIGP